MVQTGPSPAKRRRVTAYTQVPDTDADTTKPGTLLVDDTVSSWSQGLNNHLNDMGQNDILETVDRLFVMAESVFPVCPETGSLLAPYVHNAKQVTEFGAKSHVTIMVSFNANGRLCPRLLVVPKDSLLEEASPDWCVAKAESGNMSSAVFEDYIVNSFNEWLTDYNIQTPVLLLIEDHRKHFITPQLEAICTQLQIILYCLPPNSNSLQPADLSIFAKIKLDWRNTVRIFLSSFGLSDTTVTENNIIALFNSILADPDVSINIEASFWICGLYPFSLECDKRESSTVKHMEQPMTPILQLKSHDLY